MIGPDFNADTILMKTVIRLILIAIGEMLIKIFLMKGIKREETEDLSDKRQEALQKALDNTDAEARAASGKVSDVCRNVGIGSLAIFYALLLADKEPAIDFYRNYKFSLSLIALFGALTFLVDYLQYIFGYMHLRNRLKVFTSPNLSVTALNLSQNSYYRTASLVSFFVKSVFAGICCILLVYVIASYAEIGNHM